MNNPIHFPYAPAGGLSWLMSILSTVQGIDEVMCKAGQLPLEGGKVPKIDAKLLCLGLLRVIKGVIEGYIWIFRVI